MRTIFKQLKFHKKTETNRWQQRSSVEFYVPGVNSGVYDPPSLHITMQITELKPRLFRFSKQSLTAGITLTVTQFDELFEEMQKIKALREISKPSFLNANLPPGHERVESQSGAAAVSAPPTHMKP